MAGYECCLSTMPQWSSQVMVKGYLTNFAPGAWWSPHGFCTGGTSRILRGRGWIGEVWGRIRGLGHRRRRAGFAAWVTGGGGERDSRLWLPELHDKNVPIL